MSRKPIMDKDKEITGFSYRDSVLIFLPLAGAAVSLFYSILFEFYFDYHLANQIVITFSALYLLSFLFLKLKLTDFGRHFLTIIFLIEVAIHSFYLFPKEGLFHLYFLVGIPLIFMLFSRKNNISRIVYSIISTILLFSLEFGLELTQPSSFYLTPDMILLIKNSNVISSVFVFSLTTYLFTSMMESAEEKAYINSITDHLTALFNRRYFFSIANDMLQKSQLNDTPLTLAFLDLDHFKAINDEHGHSIGDQVLILVANILNNNTREADIIARIGGEEFVIIFAQTAGPHGSAKAEVIRQAVLESTIPNTSQVITISIGVTELKTNDTTINQLLKRADDALYQAKENGRNQIISHFEESNNHNAVIPIKQTL